jgi:ribosomal protein L30/L7E
MNGKMSLRKKINSMNGRKRRIKFIVDTLGLNLIPNNKCKN